MQLPETMCASFASDIYKPCAFNSSSVNPTFHNYLHTGHLMDFVILVNRQKALVGIKYEIDREKKKKKCSKSNNDSNDNTNNNNNYSECIKCDKSYQSQNSTSSTQVILCIWREKKLKCKLSLEKKWSLSRFFRWNRTMGKSKLNST